jgi:nicotinamide-nucleotide adenylyltransferase
MNGLLIGRFQPFHLGHLDALTFALSKVEKLWIGIGSSNKPNQKQNPFSADERKEMILSSIDKSILDRIQIFYIPDLANHEKWIENIDTVVPKFDIVFTNDELTKFLYSKRGTTVYSVPFTKRNELSGTNIRDKIMSDQRWEHLVPIGTKKILDKIGAKERLKFFNYK